jgi:hypothetical protein
MTGYDDVRRDPAALRWRAGLSVVDLLELPVTW